MSVIATLRYRPHSFRFADKSETIARCSNRSARPESLSGAEQSAEMEHLIHFSQKVTS
jgi:hypothetical protein